MREGGQAEREGEERIIVGYDGDQCISKIKINFFHFYFVIKCAYNETYRS